MSDPPPYSRSPKAFPAQLQAQRVDLDDMVDVYTLEVSLEGMFIPAKAANKVLPEGAVVTLHLRARGGIPDLRAIARVHKVVPPNRDAAEAGLYVQFLELRPEQVSGLATERPVRADRKAAVDLAPARILVVDDDPLVRRQAEEAMRSAGYEVLRAQNGVEALSVALSEEIDLLLADVNMPSMDGWQLLRLVRSRTHLAHLPIIFLTRLTSDAERLKGYELGVNDYVDKPFRPEDLIRRVAAQLEQQRREVVEDARHVLRGDLSQITLGSLLSLIEMERRTGRLHLQRGNRHYREQAVLYIRRGMVIRIDLDRRYNYKRNLERFFHVLDWPDGTFELSAIDVELDVELEYTTSFALLEHAKALDEGRARTQAPDPATARSIDRK